MISAMTSATTMRTGTSRQNDRPLTPASAAAVAWAAAAPPGTLGPASASPDMDGRSGWHRSGWHRSGWHRSGWHHAGEHPVSPSRSVRGQPAGTRATPGGARRLAPDGSPVSGVRGSGPLARGDLAAFPDPGGLPAQGAKIVELGPADAAARYDLDLVNRRGVHREGALHADAVADLADGERLARAAALAPDHHALEDLDAGTGSLGDLDVYAQRIARPEVRDVGADLCLLKLGNRGVHRYGSSVVITRTHAFALKSVSSVSFAPGGGTRQRPGGVLLRRGGDFQCAIPWPLTGKPASASTARS